MMKCRWEDYLFAIVESNRVTIKKANGNALRMKVQQLSVEERYMKMKYSICQDNSMRHDNGQ